MTDPTSAPDAVQVIADALHGLIANDRGRAEAAVSALAAAGLLRSPDEATLVAALEAVAEAAGKVRRKVDLEGVVSEHADAMMCALRTALDAVPATGSDLPPPPADMASRARQHSDGKGLPGAGVRDDPEEMAARIEPTYLPGEMMTGPDLGGEVAIESLLDTLPIAEMAALVRTGSAAIRDVTRGAIVNAVRHGVAPEEAARRIGVTMRTAISVGGPG